MYEWYEENYRKISTLWYIYLTVYLGRVFQSSVNSLQTVNCDFDQLQAEFGSLPVCWKPRPY